MASDPTQSVLLPPMWTNLPDITSGRNWSKQIAVNSGNTSGFSFCTDRDNVGNPVIIIMSMPTRAPTDYGNNFYISNLTNSSFNITYDSSKPINPGSYALVITIAGRNKNLPQCNIDAIGYFFNVKAATVETFNGYPYGDYRRRYPTDQIYGQDEPYRRSVPSSALVRAEDNPVFGFNNGAYNTSGTYFAPGRQLSSNTYFPF